MGYRELLIQSSGAEGTLEPAAMAVLTRSIRFGEKDAADALLPRTQVEAVSIDDPIAVLVAKAIASGKSRFPVVGADLDDVRGVVHVKDVYNVAFEQRDETPVETIMSPRSEEHTSELQSLMRISYAVFCLKKKKEQNRS